jgi:hypothetical protein
VRRLRLVLVVAALAATACSNGGGSDAGDRTSPEAGDVFLDPFDEIGPNRFTSSVALGAIPPVEPTAEEAGSDQGLRSVRGTAPGLYAGAPGQQVCDAAAAINSLVDNDDKAQAWVDALNDDPQLSWSGGSKLAAEDIPTYVAELTGVFVRSDTRVTSHGFVNRQALVFQSVLQRGTAVLIDTRGVPRARCAGLNPLFPPRPAADPKYRGEEWEGFDKTKLVTVEPGGETESFRVVDVHTKQIVEIPAGQGVLTPQTTTTLDFLDEETTTTTAGRTTTTRRTTTSGAPATTAAPTTTLAPTTTVPVGTTTTAPL